MPTTSAAASENLECISRNELIMQTSPTEDISEGR